jgi:hypothetical protein
MKKLKSIGYTLIALSITVLIAMFVNNLHLWKVVDIVMILVSLISGIILVKNH